MKAQELRIGNLVNVPNKEQSPFRIDYFDENKVYQNQGFYNTEFGLVPYHPLTWDISDCAPIPLTPEILEKCGFEKFKGLWNYKLVPIGYELNLVKINGLNENEFENQIGESIKHLHHLQNLYYALTGEELHFKP